MSDLFAQGFRNIPYLGKISAHAQIKAVPERLLIQPVDIWPGDAEKGQSLCSGALDFQGDTLEIKSDFWNPKNISYNWIIYIHEFHYLRDLRSLRTPDALSVGRGMILDWIKEHKQWKKLNHCIDSIGERLFMWITHYDFFFSNADEEEIEIFFSSLQEQAQSLKHYNFSKHSGAKQYETYKALVYSSLCLENNGDLKQKALNVLQQHLNEEILLDGGHISRNPEYTLTILRTLLDIRNILNSSGAPIPGFLQDIIERMGKAMRFFMHHDKALAVFHGGQESNKAWLESTLNQSRKSSKTKNSLPQSGFERIKQGRSLIIADTGKNNKHQHTNSHDSGSAFEFSYGKERILVSCGSHPHATDWQDALKNSAAHNKLTLSGQEDKKRKRQSKLPPICECEKHEKNGYSEIKIFNANRKGLYGFEHTRLLELNNQGATLKGCDYIHSNHDPTHPLQAALRFHLHPRVLVSLINNDSEALLRLPTGIGFRFKTENHQIHLENSIYLGSGCFPRKTKQLVIYSHINTDSHLFDWIIHREGI